MNVILIIGATGGIGEAFARRWHGQDKKVLLTGRREERLKQIQSDLPGSETLVMDNSDLASLPQKVKEITSKFPKLDTVWINSGIQTSYKASPNDPYMTSEMRGSNSENAQIDDPSSSSDQAIEQESYHKRYSTDDSHPPIHASSTSSQRNTYDHFERSCVHSNGCLPNM